MATEAQRAAGRRHYARNSTRLKAKVKAFSKANPEYRAKNQRAYAQRNPEKVRAQQVFLRAVKSGRLSRKGPHAHHSDYSRPLAVRFLSPSAHGLQHRGPQGPRRKRH